jgi:aryl-alcohol dehydrogenase-like predicted oxidoreductase
MTPQPLALGTMPMTGCYGPVARASAIATLERFIERGFACVDTADLYGDGECEILVGEALRPWRKQVQICTKFGFTFGSTAAARGLDARPERVEPACDASLRRLGVEQIDLYYLHRIDPVIPLEETVGAMKRLVEKGKVGALGLCEVSAGSLRRAHAVHPVAAVQCEYSLWSREPEVNLLDACETLDSVFFGYAPLGRGFLTGKIRRPEDLPAGDQRREYPRFQGENFFANLRLADQVRAIAPRMSATAAQLAIAWTRRRANVTPVVGATTVGELDESIGALSLKLEAADIALLEAAMPPHSVAGERYPPAAMRRLDRSA